MTSTSFVKMIPLCALLALACGCVVFPMGALEQESFSYEGIDAVEVKAEFLSVEVSAADGGGSPVGSGGSDGGEDYSGASVSMTSELPDESVSGPRHFTVKHQVVGSKLTVWVEKDPRLWTFTGSGRLLFSVPQGTSLSVETVSGSARVTGLAADRLRVSTVSGGIGMVRVAGPLALSSVSGSMTLDGASGTLSAHSVSGSITGTAISLEGNSTLDTTSGSISLRFASPLENYRFELSSVSGNLVVGTIMSARGLRAGSGPVAVRGTTVSGSQSYR